MEIARYICTSCYFVRVKGIRTGESIPLHVRCTYCGNQDTSELEVPVMDIEEYVNEQTKVLADSKNGSIDTFLAATLAEYLFKRELTQLKAKNADLISGIIELRDWAEDRVEITKKQSEESPGRGTRAMYKERCDLLAEMSEHCQALLD